MSAKPTVEEALHIRAREYIDKVVQQVVEGDVENPTFTSVGNQFWQDKGASYKNIAKEKASPANTKMEQLRNEGDKLFNALQGRCGDSSRLSGTDRKILEDVKLTKDENEALMIKLAIPKGKPLNECHMGVV